MSALQPTPVANPRIRALPPGAEGDIRRPSFSFVWAKAGERAGPHCEPRCGWLNNHFRKRRILGRDALGIGHTIQ